VTGPGVALTALRQHKLFLVLVMLFVCPSLISCGGPKSATPPSKSQNATVHAAQPARAAPSASAKMICASETQTELAAVLGIHTTQPVVPTWTNHLYSCRYTYHHAFIVLSVKELFSQSETDAYFTSLAHRLGQTQRPQAISRGAFFTTKNLSVVVRKDYKVLLVDTSGLPALFGAPLNNRGEIAVTVAATIMDCWTGA
jgi:hypothetical protein